VSALKRTSRYNRIWLPVALILTILLGIISAKSFLVQAMALEQSARCGIEEHFHLDTCYRDGSRICGIPAHTHTENCYLVLLKDNDINKLLAQVEKQPDNSLETMIGRSVDGALLFNHNLTSPLASQEVQASDLAAINETIEVYGVQPQVRLNENLYHAASGEDGALPVGLNQSAAATMQTGTAAEQTQQTGQAALLQMDPLRQSGQTDAAPTQSGETMLLQAPQDPLSYAVEGGISTLALDDGIEYGGSMANYYVYLDNSWRTVGALEFTAARSGNRYYARESGSEVVSLYNAVLGTNLTYNTINLRYATSPTAYSWTAATKNNNYIYYGQRHSQLSSAQATKYVRLTDSSGDPLAYYTVTFQHLDGTQTVQYVRAGSEVTMPAGSNWIADNVEYAESAQVTINSTMSFTAVQPDGRIRLVYDVNFPTVSGVTVSTKPTILGSAHTELTDVVELEGNARIRNVSQQEVIGKVNGNNVGLSRVVRFSGWRIAGTDTVLSANATLTWAELQAYVGNGSVLRLEGIWEYRAQQTASFYIRYDSMAVDTEGNMTSQDSNLYTPELFATFVGGADAATESVNELNELYYIADTTSDNSYGADQAIRAMYGQTADIWLQSFPRDEDIFEQLKDYAEYLEVDGQPVDVNDLNSHGYTIRWYVFKCQSDAWHIDGRLVKKEGYLDVTKTFAGNKAAVAEAIDDFCIQAVNEDGDQRYYFYIQEPAVSPQDGTVLTPSEEEGVRTVPSLLLLKKKE